MRFFRSLQWRLVFIFTAFAIVLVVIIGIVLNNRVHEYIYEEFKNKLEYGFNYKGWDTDEKTEQISYHEIEIDLWAKDDARKYFDIWSENKSYSILSETASEIHETSYSYKDNMDKYNKFYSEILKSSNLLSVASQNQKIGSKAIITRSATSSFFDYARRIKIKEGYIILYFRYDSADWSYKLDRFSRIILVSMLFAIIGSFVIGYLLAKTITGPIVSIMYKAQKLAAGDFDQVIEAKSDDEIGELTKTFNYMARELKTKLIEISSEKNKVETILNYMTDGVLAFDAKGEVIHINPAAKAMLRLNDSSECYLSSFNGFAAKYGFDLTLEEITYLESTGSHMRNIKIGDIYIRAYFARINFEDKKVGGIVAALQDITEHEKLENMRKDFVANVSHELKTPLTSIKSYTETLMEDDLLDDKETSLKFLGVINNETDRMTRLVIDLLQLSRLDSKQMQWKISNISIVELVKNAVFKVKIEAKNKKIELENFVIGDVPEIEADYDRVEQVFLNILTNAINYTAEGGRISVYVSKRFSEVYVKISDTGIGIPEKEIPMIFDRFYRVDKARSREMGGTGLGLAIAKEITEAHGGSIDISSVQGKGTDITIRLPVKQKAQEIKETQD